MVSIPYTVCSLLVCVLAVSVTVTAADNIVLLSKQDKLQVLRFFSTYFDRKQYKGCRATVGFTFCSDIDIEVDSRLVSPSG